jgi:predicted transcriptional regulator
MIKTVKTLINSTVDSQTGEILDVDVKHTKLFFDNETFSLIYASFWDIITESNLSKADIELLGYLISHYGKGTPFNITSYIKESIAKKSNKNPTSYNKSTKALVNAGFIIEKKSKTYILNPHYAFQGSSADRRKAIIELHNKNE